MTHSASGRPLDCIVEVHRSCRGCCPHTYQMVGQPSTDCPIVFVAVGHRETVSPRSTVHTLDWHEVGHGSDFLGLDTHVLDNPMGVKVSLPHAEMVLPQVVQFPLQRAASCNSLCYELFDNSPQS